MSRRDREGKAPAEPLAVKRRTSRTKGRRPRRRCAATVNRRS